jgi:hypothetical protein
MRSRVVSWRLFGPVCQRIEKMKSEGQTGAGAIAPSLDTSCTNRTGNKTRRLQDLWVNWILNVYSPPL